MANPRHTADAPGYPLTQAAHDRLCRLYEHIALLALLSERHVPGTPIPTSHWAACLHTLADELDQALAPPLVTPAPPTPSRR